MSSRSDPSIATAAGLGIEWTRWIRRGDRVVCAQMTGTPRVLLVDLAAALAAGRAALPASLFLGTPFSTEAAAFPAAVRLEVLGGMGTAAEMGRTRPLSIYPVPYSRTPDLFARREVVADVALVSLARHSGTGRLHLAPSHGYIIEAARRARHVIAGINAAAPCVRGAEWPMDLVPDVAVDVCSPLPVASHARMGDVERRIAAHVADCVPDGAYVEVGIGAVASAVAAGLGGRRRLCIHSGLFTEALWSLVRSGAVEAPAAGEPLVTCSAVFGTPELYAEVHDRPAYRIAPPSVTHGAASLAALPRFTAINVALEVDLLGQVNAESVGGRYLGGVGGLNDFVRGALACPDGTAIIAIPSRRKAAPGDAAGIVAALSGPATVAASDADVFVSEHGIARVRGDSRAERARALIAIAHPEDRERLTRAAGKMGLA